jgi:acyl-ACP thioesterase
VRPSGRARLDAAARYLQDVAADDIADSGVADDLLWVVRTTAFEITVWPRYDDDVAVVTWCSGTGRAWAERRTTITTSGAVALQAVSVWVSLDPTTMRPAPLGPGFAAVYLPSTAGRKVRSRLAHPGPDEAAAPRRWSLRATDYDLLGHVNNVVAWIAVEDELARLGSSHRVVFAEVEYASQIEAADDVVLMSSCHGDELMVWLLGPDDKAAVSARVILA